jgi:hypothetical protein
MLDELLPDPDREPDEDNEPYICSREGKPSRLDRSLVQDEREADNADAEPRLGARDSLRLSQTLYLEPP